MVSSAFGANKDKYLNSKQRFIQHITAPKKTINGAMASWESSVNGVLGRAAVLNDDEYKMKIK